MEGNNATQESQTTNATQGSQSTNATQGSQTSRAAGNKRWTPSESRYFIKFMAGQVEEGLKVDKGFKPQAIHAAVKAMKDAFKTLVTEANVHNHLRTIRRRWARIKKLKELSGMGWDDVQKMIVMGEAEYLEYIQIHPQDEPYLNKPIEDYDMIEAICGNDQATGSRAVQFGSRLGTQMDDDTAPEDMPPTEQFNDMFFGDANVIGNASPAFASPSMHSQPITSENTTATSPTQRRKGKGKRKANVSDDSVRELATTIRDAFESVRSSRTLSFAKELQDECLKVTQYGYSTQDAMILYRFLMKDDNEARTFFAMCEDFRKIWLNQFFGGAE